MSQVEDRINNLEKRINNLSEKNKYLNNKLNCINEPCCPKLPGVNLKPILNSITNINTAITNINTEITDIDNSITNINNAITNINNEITIINNKSGKNDKLRYRLITQREIPKGEEHAARIFINSNTVTDVCQRSDKMDVSDYAIITVDSGSKTLVNITFNTTTLLNYPSAVSNEANTQLGFAQILAIQDLIQSYLDIIPIVGSSFAKIFEFLNKVDLSPGLTFILKGNYPGCGDVNLMYQSVDGGQVLYDGYSSAVASLSFTDLLEEGTYRYWVEAYYDYDLVKSSALIGTYVIATPVLALIATVMGEGDPVAGIPLLAELMLTGGSIPVGAAFSDMINDLINNAIGPILTGIINGINNDVITPFNSVLTTIETGFNGLQVPSFTVDIPGFTVTGVTFTLPGFTIDLASPVPDIVIPSRIITIPGFTVNPPAVVVPAVNLPNITLIPVPKITSFTVDYNIDANFTVEFPGYIAIYEELGIKNYCLSADSDLNYFGEPYKNVGDTVLNISTINF